MVQDLDLSKKKGRKKNETEHRGSRGPREKCHDRGEAPTLAMHELIPSLGLKTEPLTAQSNLDLKTCNLIDLFIGADQSV